MSQQALFAALLCLAAQPTADRVFARLLVVADSPQPFVVERANQEHSAGADITVLVQALSRMLAVPNTLVQFAAVEVLLAFASAGDAGPWTL